MMDWTPGMTIEAVEQIAIEKAIKFYQGNKTQTALALGISVRTLDHKLEKYSADRKRTEEARDKRRAEDEDYLRRSRGLPRTATGILLEPSAPAVAQHAVPLPKREEVQEVLQRHDGARGPKRSSRTA